MIDLDPRYEVARQLAAEQHAMRFVREQTVPQLPRDIPPPLPTTSQVQEIGRGGLTGSRQLGRSFEAMLRDGGGEATVEVESSPLPTPSELPVFVPRGSSVEESPWNPRAVVREQDPGDLNLSWQNRERAINQGLPTSLTARAAAEMYR